VEILAYETASRQQSSNQISISKTGLYNVLDGLKREIK